MGKQTFWRMIAGAALAFVLVGCSPAPEQSFDKKAVPNLGVVAESAPAADVAAPEPVAASGGGAVPVAGAMLAFRYDAGLTLPADQIRPMLAAHEKACVAAGPAVCQVVGSRIAQQSDDALDGSLDIRARPDFAQNFVASLEGDAAKAKGRFEQSRTSEDLTRQIIDTEASLRAKTTLRDRLQALLKDRPGRLSDLLETEQALANVQQEIDSAQSILAEMKTRVATSQVSVRYVTLNTLISGGDFNPLDQAANDFFRNMASALAAIITLISFLIPWLIVLIPLGWLLRRGLKWLLSRRKTSATSGAESSAAAKMDS